MSLLDVSDVFAPEELLRKGIDKVGTVEPDTIKRKLCHGNTDDRIFRHFRSPVVSSKYEAAITGMRPQPPTLSGYAVAPELVEMTRPSAQ